LICVRTGVTGTTAGGVELSGEVIESPHGLHSNAYKFPANARLMTCKDIGRPQMGQATSLPGVDSLLKLYLSTRWRDPDNDADQLLGQRGF